MKTIGEIKEEFSAAREADWNAICQMYETDLRSGVQKLVQQYRKKLDALDVSVILNNALENAVEAAGAYKENHEQSHVRICSYRKSNAYMIEVVNSFEGVVEMNSDTGLPVTQKQTKGHGYGPPHN